MSVLLHFIRWQCGLARAETQTTSAERDTLAKYAAGRRIAAEIGVWHGVTTRRLRSVLATDGVLYAVDPYPTGRLGVSFQQRIAKSEVGKMRNAEIRWVRATGAEAGRQLASELAGKLDFLFIDGDHSYDGLKGDWESWSPLIAVGGVVALHDSRPTPSRPIHDAGSVRFTNDAIRNDPRFELLDEIDSLTVLQRVSK